ncbi:AKP8L protein, partial [Vireo altiloquus]|nr:AKP8L protein [Vireo altiloquus]
SFLGYGDWNSGSSRGYEGYGYGYGYGQENSAGFGYGAAAGNSWDLGNSEPDGAPEGGTELGKQRLELGTHPESEGMQGRGYGAAGDRYDPYESFDSRSSLNDRDAFRPSYDNYPSDNYPSDNYPNDNYPNDNYPNDYPGDYPNDY